jgi:putative FmdB family regulatory protein
VPTYQYACTACGHRFEAVQSFSDASLTECPECAGRLRKVFSSVGVVFKGSGFYRTDSRAPVDGAKGDGPKIDVKGDTKSDGAKGDTKGDTKSDSGKGDGATKAAPSSASSAAATSKSSTAGTAA